jgi:peptide/nickel transport system substrate-binding protein
MSTAADAITRLIRSLVAASEPRRALGPRWGGPATGGRSWAIAAGGVLLWLLAGVSPAAAEKVLRVGVIRDPVNSQYATPGVEPYITGVYEQLVFVTPSMELAPGLATSWERLGDNQWRFRLRRGVKFHNGKDFNAQTAKFSLDWITEKIVWSKRLRIKEVKVVDDYTIDIFTTTPLAVMPGFMSHGWTVMSEPESQKAGKPVGTGPFKFVSSVPAEQLVVSRNEHYWQPGVPKIDRIVFRIAKDDTSRVLALMSDQIDVALQVPYPNVQQIKAAGFQTFQTLTSVWANLTFAASTPPTDEVRVRKAVVHAIDRQAIIEKVLYGMGMAANTPIHPDTPWSGESKLKGLPHDPKLAESLLEQAGWRREGTSVRRKAGQPLALTLRVLNLPGTLIAGREMAQVVADQLRRVGIDVTLSVEEGNMFYDQSAASQKGHVYLDYTGTYSGELSATLWDLFQPNRPTYVEGSALYGNLIPAVAGEWLGELQNTQAAGVRERNLIRLAELVNRDLVLTVPFVKYQMVVGASPKVTGYQPHPLFFWPHVWNAVDLK